MINISENELNKLERVGSGGFGSVYKVGDKAYKIYTEYIKTGYDTTRLNPMLKNSSLVLNKMDRLIKINHRIEHTDLIEDTIFINNKFRGVVMPFYNGIRLFDIINEPLIDKIKYARKYLECARELTLNHIYPTDYKLNNVLLVDDEIKIIDLDDPFTKVRIISDPLLNKKSIIIFDETIKAFFKENDYHYFLVKLKDYITYKTPNYNDNYEGIIDYINDKTIEHNYVFIDLNSNYDLSFDFVDDNSRVVLLYDEYNNDKIINIVKSFNEKNIQIYDVISSWVLDRYIINNAYNECVINKEKEFVKIR